LACAASSAAATCASTPRTASWSNEPDPQRATQVDALDQHHVQVQLTVDLAEVVDRHDVRVLQPGHDPRLAAEPDLVLAVGAGQPLQRHDPVVHRVVRAVHHPHPAPPQQLPDVVRPEVG